jgi:ADP-ribosylation factor-binding protein GGA
MSVEIWHARERDKKVESIKLRWRLSYKVGGEQKLEMGGIPEFAVA